MKKKFTIRQEQVYAGNTLQRNYKCRTNSIMAVTMLKDIR